MAKRKWLVALYSSLISTLIIGLPMAVESKYEVLHPFLFVACFVVPIHFTVGVATSILSDLLVRRVQKCRAILACIVHVCMGIVFSCVFTIFVTQQLKEFIFIVPAVIGSAAFWIVDETLRRKKAVNY